MAKLKTRVRATKRGYKHKDGTDKLARALARSDNVYGGKKDKGVGK